MSDEYELQKQIAIKDALLAEWELKNRTLRESVNASVKKRGDLEELLKVQQVVYEAKLKKLYAELQTANHRGVEALRIMKADEAKYKKLQESHKLVVSEFTEHISKQDMVIEDLTDENQRLTLDLGKGLEQRETLKKNVEELKHRRQVLTKLEKVLEQFE